MKIGTPVFRSYTAGVIDSDGCITIKKRFETRKNKGKGRVYYALFIVVAQCGGDDEPPPVISLLHRAYGGSMQCRKHPGNRRTMWHLEVSTMAAEKMLRSVFPYLVGKRRQAEIALEYRETAMGRGKRELATSYYWKLRGEKNYHQKEESA